MSIKNSGITLTELIIALVVVSIMLPGIFSANYALQNMDRSSVTRSALFVRTQALVSSIMRDAMSAIGMRRDMGICINRPAPLDNTNYICFRNAAKWACYSFLGAANTDVHRCEHPITVDCNTGPDPTACSACGQSACVEADNLAGTMDPDSFTLTSPVFNTKGFVMAVVNREDPASAKSATNPEVAITVTAYPEGHSF